MIFRKPHYDWATLLYSNHADIQILRLLRPQECIHEGPAQRPTRGDQETGKDRNGQTSFDAILEGIDRLDQASHHYARTRITRTLRQSTLPQCCCPHWQPSHRRSG